MVLKNISFLPVSTRLLLVGHYQLYNELDLLCVPADKVYCVFLQIRMQQRTQGGQDKEAYGQCL